MANSVLFDSYRNRLAAFMVGGGSLTPFAFMAFGDGGHNPDLSPKPPSAQAEGLFNEVLRKPLFAVTQEDPLSSTGKGVIDEDELIGFYISEAMLLDSNGLPVAMKTFAPKIKEADEQYEIGIKVKF